MNGQIAQPETTLSRFHTWLAQSLVNNNEFFAYFEPFIRLAMPAWSTVGVRSRVMKVHSETGVEYLYRVDVAVGFAGSDDVIRTVTGFIGEPGIPGEANRAWSQAREVIGENQ